MSSRKAPVIGISGRWPPAMIPKFINGFALNHRYRKARQLRGTALLRTDCYHLEEKARKDFYSQAFIDLLNANRGGGREWTLAAEGYPHLGEAQEYIPPEDMKITFNYLPTLPFAVLTPLPTTLPATQLFTIAQILSPGR